MANLVLIIDIINIVFIVDISYNPMILNKSFLKKLLLLSCGLLSISLSVYFNVLRSRGTIIILNAKNAQEDNS